MTPRRPIPDDFAEIAKRHSQSWMTKYYRTNMRIVSRWIAESGLEKPGLARRPIPDDFATVFASLPSQKAVAAHYRTAKKVVIRWMKEAGLTARERALRPVPDDFAEVAPTMLRSALRGHYDCSYDVLDRWIAESGIKSMERVKAVRPLRPARPAYLVPTRGTGKPNLTITRATSIYDDAADVLRRFGPVNRCNEDGWFNDCGKFWRVGRVVVTPAELLERAARKQRRAA